MTVTTWLNYMSSVVRDGFGFGSYYSTLQGLTQSVAFPLMGPAASPSPRATSGSGRHRAGQHSHLLVLARRDRFRDQHRHLRILLNRSD
jgi:hypothetical protein